VEGFDGFASDGLMQGGLHLMKKKPWSSDLEGSRRDESVASNQGSLNSRSGSV
jgi:hypothetical protein